ncbi:AfsR/SARP family transcriptional regulator [Streptomyces formicae]|uniref:AfsR/SARP family transcriptional regulator n=1 Tax=Streptomyces formicae TaxID=1616117 RepID=UPI00131C9939|nr:BTAD domain-containing putative transcriptional regulator [Streptomyces formicae]
MIAGPRQRTILATLVLAWGRAVSVDSLVDAVWGNRPPNTARTQVAICVGALRKAFRAAHIEGPVIQTTHPGYRLLTQVCSLDARDFAALTGEAAEAIRLGREDEAVGLYRKALYLWTGPALSGVAGQAVEDEATRLEAERLVAYEALFDAELALGRHQEVLPELSAMADDQPLHEKLRHNLMLAQYRCGRRAEAAEGFRTWRKRFVDEIGMEPSASIHQLHRAILQDAPELSLRGEEPPRPGRRVAPVELPAGVTDFLGREAELAALDALLTEPADGRHLAGGTPPRMAIIAGPAGVGKTSLAVHWAHRAARHFPDGSLYADLSQYEWTQGSATVHALLSRFLRVLGVAAELVPDRLDECVSLYRSLLAERRALVVLDNVHALAHIQPFLPGCGRSRVVATTSGRQDPLAVGRGAVRVDLDPLPAAQAAELVAGIIGERRALEDPAAVHELGRLCDRLPLALRAAAGRLVAKPHWSVRRLVFRLADDRRRLDELSAGGLELRAGFWRGYRGLPDAAARMCRMLGLLDTPVFTARVGAALLDVDHVEAEDAMEQLFDVHLLTAVGADSGGELRYAFPELARLFAHERALTEESDETRQAALSRLLWTQLASI